MNLGIRLTYSHDLEGHTSYKSRDIVPMTSKNSMNQSFQGVYTNDLGCTNNHASQSKSTNMVGCELYQSPKSTFTIPRRTC